MNLRDVDLSVAKNRVEEDIVLPKGRGKPIKICVFGSAELAAKAATVADLVVQPQEIEALAGDKRKARQMAAEYDYFIAEAPLMRVIGARLGAVLGPRGKMPRVVPPGGDPTGIIRNMRSTVRLRSKDKRTFHAPIGVRTMTPEDLAENLDFLIKRLVTKLERGKFNIHSIYVKTTMGPSERVM